MSTLDIAVFVVYCVIIISVGLWVSREKVGHQKNADDYFLASKTLPWWAIGASLIASNISAEQFIGMSGSGFAMGLAIATYEWMAAATLIVVGVYFLPVFLKNRIYTMPQYLEQRYDTHVRTLMAVFWLLVYVFVNLTSVLYLGALSISSIMGVPFVAAVIGLAAFALLYSVYGGLKAVAWTDVVQVFFLIMGGLFATYLGLDLVGGGDAWQGFLVLKQQAPSHFHMIFEPGQMLIPDGAGGTRDAYMDLPGLSVLIGGMWIANLSYWGCNQYITQRALAAKDLREARRGVMFAAFLKLLMPLVVVIPGIAAFVIVQNENGIGDFTAAMTEPVTGIIKSDRAYPTLLNLLPSGVKGIAFAALVAAIVSSLASIANSTSTIFTMDIYRNYIDKQASQKKLVTIGRVVVVCAFAIALLVAPSLGALDQVFQFIQEYTGFVSPGVAAIFIVGLAWRKATAGSALFAAILTIPLSATMKFLTPNLPFLDRMGVAFLVLVALMVAISLIWPSKTHHEHFVAHSDTDKTGWDYRLGSVLICGVLAALYAVFW